MSIDNFVESLKRQLNDAKARRATAEKAGEKGAITREIKFIEQKIHMATRDYING